MSRTAALGILILTAGSRAEACATCVGAPDDPHTLGMNAAVFTLLGVTTLVAIGLGAVLKRIAASAAQGARD